jgi:hypothetical protein
MQLHMQEHSEQEKRDKSLKNRFKSIQYKSAILFSTCTPITFENTEARNSPLIFFAHTSHICCHGHKTAAIIFIIFIIIWNYEAWMYNHPPSSSVGSHVLISGNLSVLSSTMIIS